MPALALALPWLRNRSESGAFSPLTTSPSVWYDPSTISTLFTTSFGTVAVASNADPVGLELDRSVSAGSNLVANSGFDTDVSSWTNASLGTGTWTWQSPGYGRITNGTNRGIGKQTVTIVSGQRYRVTEVVVASTTNSQPRLRIGSIDNGSDYVDSSSTSSFVGTRVYWFTAIGTSAFVSLAENTATSGYTVDWDSVTIQADDGNHASQATAGQRFAYSNASSLYSVTSDGVDDNLTSATGGGGNTAFAFIASVKVNAVGVRQTLYADNGTNTGYKVEFNASNQLVLSAGNGTSFTTATSGNTVSSGQVVSIECFDDGTNLSVTLNNGTPVTTARPSVSVGTAGFTMSKDNGAASGYGAFNYYQVFVGKNKSFTSGERASLVTYVRTKAGI